MNSLMVVAHPDDESMWGAGYLIRHPGTTVVCCTIPRRDPERAWRFFDACQVLGAIPRLLPFPEPPANERIDEDTLGLIDFSGYDEVITHNEVGEYGHLHHKQINAYVTSVTSCNTFGVGLDYASTMRLSDEEGARKIEALKCYSHIMPYDGVLMPKWEALVRRYGDELDMFRSERYAA